jgi:PhnB protein
MKSAAAYLLFDGKTREAMSFYKECLGGDLYLQTFAEAKMKTPPGHEDRIVHSRLARDGVTVAMASDPPPGNPLTVGNNFSICIECQDEAEQDRFFTALSKGGEVTMPLQDTFWGARFGMLTDRYGIRWMFNLDRHKT